MTTPTMTDTPVDDRWEAEACITGGSSQRPSPAPCSAASAWPLKDVVAKLIEASDILLDEKDYDGHGYELIWEARKHARGWVEQQNGEISSGR